jgi:hypothetical protein
MTAHTAPARYALTVLHRQDPADLPILDPATAEYVDGWTRCGQPMLRGDLWRPIEARDGDPLCPGCENPGAAPAADIQEALL